MRVITTTNAVNILLSQILLSWAIKAEHSNGGPSIDSEKPLESEAEPLIGEDKPKPPPLPLNPKPNVPEFECK